MTTYKIFKIGDLFDYETGDTDLKKSDLTANGYPLVSSGFTDRGVIGKTSKPSRIHRGGAITVDMFGYAYYRQKDFKMVTHARVFALYLKDGQNMTDRVGLYLASCLAYLPKLFSYSYMCNFSKISGMNIVLPIDESTGEPDWGYMDRYIQEIEDRYIQEIEDYFEVAGIDSAELTDDEKEILQKIPKFHEFRIGDLFDIHPTNAYKKTNRELYKLKGSTRVLSNTCEDNGTGGKCGLEPTETAGVITFSDTTTGPNTMFYQPTDFIGYPHVQGMYFTSGVLSENIGLYLVSVMKRSSGTAWSYARKYTREHVSNLRILLPIDSNNKPNWDYMYKYTEVTKKIAIARYANSEERKIKLAKKILNDKNH